MSISIEFATKVEIDTPFCASFDCSVLFCLMPPQ